MCRGKFVYYVFGGLSPMMYTNYFLGFNAHFVLMTLFLDTHTHIYIYIFFVLWMNFLQMYLHVYVCVLLLYVSNMPI
jgi:hypothetical protein